MISRTLLYSDSNSWFQVTLLVPPAAFLNKGIAMGKLGFQDCNELSMPQNECMSRLVFSFLRLKKVSMRLSFGRMQTTCSFFTKLDDMTALQTQLPH